MLEYFLFCQNFLRVFLLFQTVFLIIDLKCFPAVNAHPCGVSYFMHHVGRRHQDTSAIGTCRNWFPVTTHPAKSSMCIQKHGIFLPAALSAMISISRLNIRSETARNFLQLFCFEFLILHSGTSFLQPEPRSDHLHYHYTICTNGFHSVSDL